MSKDKNLGTVCSLLNSPAVKKTLQVLWPIERHEFKKFLPVALMMLFTLFNYNVLRSLKDALLIPNIGAEAISFVKSYVVPPMAIIAMLIYAKMTTCMSKEKIYYTCITFFTTFYIVFAFILYPYIHIIHPDPAVIERLSQSHLNLYLFNVDLSHFKWFFRLYGKWTFPLFYVLAELWGSIMLSLLFWQFANDITKTSEAKKFYPMFGFIANFGLILGGTLIKIFSRKSYAITALISMIVVSGLSLMLLYYYINKKVLTDPRYAVTTKKAKKNKPKISFSEGLKIVFSSKYIGLLAILMLSYGFSMNMIEGPWKSKVTELYPDQFDYLNFMGTLQQCTGVATVIIMLVGANILKRIKWCTGAIFTPLMMAITGIPFFIFVVFDDVVNTYIAAWFTLMSPLWLAVMFGLMQNVFSKGTKYAFFDATKEMSYIPLDEELKTKGKAAADVVAARFAKSGGAIVQSTLFIIFPAATFTSITPYLMIIFVIVILIWLVGVKLLSPRYEEALKVYNKENHH
jgi:ATP:ADP antiporter, AAA family